MLKNRWIITKKISVANCPGRFNYTIVPVDGWADKDDYELYDKDILSKRNLDIGTYTDDELNPVYEHYKYLNTDIATVESTTVQVYKPGMTRLNVFGDRFGEFSFLVDDQGIPFRIERGDNILVQRKYDVADFVWPQEPDDDDDEYSDPLLQDIMGTRREMQRCQEPEELVGPYFHILYNVTTKRKAKSFPKTKKTHSKSNFGDCDRVVVLGVSPTCLEYDMQKHLIIHSNKFGLISCLTDEYQSEFHAYTQDKLLIQQYYDYNAGEIAYRILANKTIDDMRSLMLRRNIQFRHR